MHGREEASTPLRAERLPLLELRAAAGQDPWDGSKLCAWCSKPFAGLANQRYCNICCRILARRQPAHFKIEVERV